MLSDNGRVMQTLRRSRDLARLALAWFALALGVAVAAPLVHPQAIELICSTGGQLKAVVITDDGAVELGAAHLDCPLCVPASAPPPVAFVAQLPPQLPVSPVDTTVLAPLPPAAALPWQARAPPAIA